MAEEAVKKWSWRKIAKKLFWSLIVLALAAALLWWLGPLKKWTGREVWQAVFLSNGQVYFGQMQPSLGNFVKLKNVYYLQITQQLQPPAAGQPAQPDIRLVRLGGELHGPQNAMYILRSQIIFWENLRNDSRVVQGIKQIEAQQR